jgi:hypothetical protein
MIHRVLFYGLFLAAVAVLPYASSEWLKASRSKANATASDGAASSSGLAAADNSIASKSTVALVSPPPAAITASTPPVVPLAEAVRFEATPSWVMQRWPRVTAGLPDGQLQGYRVPLITGTREDDVAGSLTYYFNAQLACQRITFQGTSGDPRKVTQYIAGQFGLTRRTSDDPGLLLYQARWNGKPVSELRIKPAPVVSASAPLARYEVQWTLSSWGRK